MRELRIVGSSMEANAFSMELAEFIATEAPTVPVYMFRPTPGVIMGAAFDWTAILSTTADVATIASALWLAYEQIIKKRASANISKSPKFLLQVRAEPQSFVQIIIGGNTTQEQFTKEFTQAVANLRSTDSASSTGSVQESYEASPNQVRVPPRKDA